MNANATFQTIQSAHDRVLALKQEVETTLERFLPKFDRFALLDFPDYANVGDSAIWLGQTTYFRQTHRAHPSLVTSILRHSIDETIRDLPDDGVIFLSGGGNFGDIYPIHQAWRNDVLRRTKGRPVVQLPQSIHFKDPAMLAETARAISEHGNFSMLVRDHNSLKIVQDNFECPVTLCPDMAFVLGPLARPAASEVDIFCLMRTDDEQVGYDTSAAADVLGVSLRSTDWLTESKEEVEQQRKPGYLTRFQYASWGGLRRSNYRNLGFHLMAMQRLKRGLSLLSSGRWVMTDRLHAHILSLLLDIPHVTLDNSYGKLSTFQRAWTDKVKNVFPMKDPTTALEFISERVREGKTT